MDNIVYQPSMQCWLVLCRKRKMIFTSSQSRLSITTPRTGSRPTVTPQDFGTRHGRAASRVCGRLANSNLQAGVPERAFACHALSNQNSTTLCKHARRLAISGHVGRRIACGQPSHCICLALERKVRLSPARRSLAPCSFSYLMCRHAALSSNTTSPGPRIEACSFHFQ